MNRQKIISQYLEAGKKLTILKGKRPLLEDWVKEIVDEKTLAKHKDNLGWVIGKDDLVIDVDPRNGGTESFERLSEMLKIKEPTISLDATVNTPSGGFHIYMKLPGTYYGARFKKNLAEYKGIDFLTYGMQCVIPSSKTEKGLYTWADDLIDGFDQVSAPNVLLKMIATKPESEDDSFKGLIGGKTANWSEERVLQMLAKLDPSMGYDDWMRVGMALHDWDPILGLQYWEDWSKAGENYEKNATSVKWRSFSIGGGVTLGTISHMVKVVNFDETLDKVQQYIERIKHADEKVLQFDICPKLKTEELDAINRGKLAKALQVRFKELTDTTVPIGNIRMLISSQQVVSGHFIEDQEQPEWCKDWIYVNSHAGFVNIHTLELNKAESFNLENGKYIPMSEGGTKMSATKYVCDRGFVDKVSSIAYLPQYEGLICNIEGKRVLNSFNKNSLPIMAKEYSPEGLKYIQRVERHIRLLCGNDHDANIFMCWIAHQVQYPGRLILWAPLFQSIEGIGKSFIGGILRTCLGDRNIGTVSPTQITSDFNGWATNHVVNILEEIRVTGHNRHECINALKPLITDRVIQINQKGVNQYMTTNTTNYCGFTNFRDALPVIETDRRWWIKYVQIESLEQLEEMVGESVSTYFPKLFDGLHDYGGELHKWFSEFTITKEFMLIKQAPMTEEKLLMISTEEYGFTGLNELRDMVRDGGFYYNNMCVSSVDLFQDFLFKHPEITLDNRQKQNLMKKMGFSCLPTPVKIDGKARKIWAKRPMSVKEVKEILKGGGEYLDDI